MKDILKKVESLISGQGVDDYEFAGLYVKSSTVESKEGKADFIAESDSLSFALRVVKGKKMGYSFSMSGENEDLGKMVEGAIFAAAYQDDDRGPFLPPGNQKYSAFDRESSYVSLPLEEKVSYAKELEGIARSADKRIKNVRYATFKDSYSRFFISSSLGIEGEYVSPLYMAYIYAVAEEERESETGFGLGFSTTFKEMEDMKESVAHEATGKALRMLGSQGIKTGKYPVIVENGAMTELLGVLSPSFNGQNVALGKSMLAPYLGKEIFSNSIDIIDDPLMGSGAGSCPFDGEGVASEIIPLVREGKLNSFLSDSYWGGRLGTGTTASLRRGGFKNPPQIGISNLYIKPGEIGLDEMIRRARNGVLLSSFLGIHTADSVSGDFSVGASGLYFEDGEIRYPVRTFAVSGNIIDFMGKVKEVGSDLKMFGTMGSPSIAFDFIDIGGN